ncbi:MAG: glycosyltransferase [Acinetobacter sp.]|uniref:glycosyltransferase n=1 Tax=Acinetobacter sp. TaxID=472 RepID=UPI00391A0696
MIFLFNLYSFTIGKVNNFSYRFIRFFSKYTLNYLTPFIYRNLRRKKFKKVNIIVSLTTFPKRIEKTWIVVESLLRQTKPPKKIVLTLSRLQFSSEGALPKELLNLRSEGLEILWTDDDLRSHKKYYYVMQKYSNDIVVTVDDDFIYEKRMLEKLLDFHEKYPKCVITHLGLKKKGVNYHDWENLFFKSVDPTDDIMPLGGSGVLYPPKSLHPDAFNKELIKQLCPLADDIWLNSMGVLNSVKVVKTDYRIYLMPLMFKENSELYKINVIDDKNNHQILALSSKYPNLFTECKK